MEDDKSPEEIAFANSVIVKEIFKNLRQWYDSKEFRQANSFIWRETLGIWRKRKKLVIEENSDEFLYELVPNPLQGLFEFYSNWEEGLASLSIHPYRHVKIRDEILSPLLPDKSTEYEKFFWSVCGLHITHLELSECHFRGDCGSETGLKLIKQILLKTCPLLESLKIQKCIQDEDQEDYDSEEENAKFNEKFELYGENEGIGKIAKKLIALHLDNSNVINMKFCRRIFRLTPNLKSLSIEDNVHGETDARVFSMFVKSQVKIERFTVTISERNPSYTGPEGNPVRYVALRRYVKAFPKTIKVLHLQTRFGDPTWSGSLLNGAMYTAIGLCENLEVLTIQYAMGSKMEWYKDLEGVPLKNLKILRIDFLYFFDFTIEITKFDFGMLREMPKLKELGIWHANKEDNLMITRKTGSGDWLFQEEVNVEPVEGEAMEDEEMEELPIPWNGSESLQRFCFKGWNLTANDIQLLHLWFPGLSGFGSHLSLDTPPSMILDLWEGTLQCFYIFNHKSRAPTYTAKFQEEFEALQVTHPNVFIEAGCPQFKMFNV